MKYELRINDNILKTDDKDVTLEFVKAIVGLTLYTPPVVIERGPLAVWGDTGTGIVPQHLMDLFKP